MSELKWNWAYYPYLAYLDPPEKQAESALKAGYIKVVNKDDADKVIADLKDKGDKIIFDLKDKLQKESALLKETRDCLIESQKMHKRCADNAIKIIRRINRKRCLAMARLCGKTVDHLNSEGYIYEKENHIKELTDCIRGTEFYDKWYHRWLALADEPTWEKFLTLIHKEAK